VSTSYIFSSSQKLSHLLSFFSFKMGPKSILLAAAVASQAVLAQQGAWMQCTFKELTISMFSNFLTIPQAVVFNIRDQLNAFQDIPAPIAMIITANVCQALAVVLPAARIMEAVPPRLPPRMVVQQTQPFPVALPQPQLEIHLQAFLFTRIHTMPPRFLLQPYPL
jgi:hypothetical protein